ncbi:cellulase family glycosylhydrolase [Legionella antarctica]|uniref:cellulase family glycosylhydrolase n=1 Tax=Legionella antarctica TaxID=2708020 RepID=UPI001563BA0D|nr:cellulase family glycosylhydrolase [Legionella antarctica]
MKPYVCIQKSQLKLAPDSSVDVGTVSYAGAALRFNGCDVSNTYLGWMNLNLSKEGNTIISYLPPEGIHIQYSNPGIDNKGRISGSIAYTPIEINEDLVRAQPATNWQFAGINLSGLEFGKVIDPAVVPNLSILDQNSPYSDLKDTVFFIEAGMNTVRIPVSWGYLQLDGPGTGSINRDYYVNYIKPLLQTLTKAKVHAVVDLHAYMRYSKFGEQYSGCFGDASCPDGDLILDEKAYQSAWGQLVTLIQEDISIDKEYIVIDLMNEPVAVPDDKVFTIQVALIKMLRAQQFKGTILIEGNNWTGLHSWTTGEWTGGDGKVYTNASLFTRENFAKSGITDLDNIVINVHQYLDSDYSGTHDTCQQDLKTEGPDGFNLDAFTQYLEKNRLKAMVTEFGTGNNASSCSQPLNEFMQYMQDNAIKDKDFGFVGWTIWSTGHGWGGYNFRVKPDSYQMHVLNQYL